MTDKVKLQVSIYNLFDSNAWAAEYFYSTAVRPGRAAADDYQVHPPEPIAARFTATMQF